MKNTNKQSVKTQGSHASSSFGVMSFLTRKGTLYVSVWGVALVLFFLVRLPHDGTKSFGLLLLLPFLPMGFIEQMPRCIGNALGDNVVLVLGWLFYILHGILFYFVDYKPDIRRLLIILSVFLFLNLQGCNNLLRGLDSIH